MRIALVKKWENMTAKLCKKCESILSILYLWKKKNVRENPYFGIFYAMPLYSHSGDRYENVWPPFKILLKNTLQKCFFEKLCEIHKTKYAAENFFNRVADLQQPYRPTSTLKDCIQHGRCFPVNLRNVPEQLLLVEHLWTADSVVL